MGRPVHINSSGVDLDFLGITIIASSQHGLSALSPKSIFFVCEAPISMFISSDGVGSLVIDEFGFPVSDGLGELSI